VTTTNFIPVKFFLPGWPTDIIGYPAALDLVGVRDFEVPALYPDYVDASGTLQLLGEIAADLPLIPGLSIVLMEDLNGGGLTEIPFSFQLVKGVFELDLSPLSAALRVQSSLLKRVELSADGYVPVIDPVTQEPIPLDVGMQSGSLLVNSAGEFTFSLDTGIPVMTIDPFMIGDTGIVFKDLDISLILSAEAAVALPPTIAPEARGVLINSAAIHLPQGLQVGIAPEEISLADAFIGTGGFSGKVSGSWNVYNQNTGQLQTGQPGVGTLFGFDFGLKELFLEFVQNAIVASSVTGYLSLPFFDEVLEVAIALAGNGEIQVTLAAADPGTGLIEITREGLFTLAINSLTIERVDGQGELSLGGFITPLFEKAEDTAEDEPPQWGTYEIKALTVDLEGRVTIDGGWLTLPEAQTLNFYGFQLEIAEFGLGNTDDGRRWIGFSGGIQLVDGLPLGGSVEGLRILWDENSDFDIELAGIGIDFEIKDTLQFSGAVAFIRDEASGIKGFRGGVRVQLTALNMWLDGQIVIMKQEMNGRRITGVYLFLEIGLPVGIPILQTGQAIFAIAGLFSYNLLPGKTDNQDWYDWYVQSPLGVTDADKWSDLQAGSFAFGAGLAIGTLPDGFPFSAEVLLVILIPGPVLLIQGKATFLTKRTELGTDSAAFQALAVLDVPAGYFLFNVDVSYIFPAQGDLRGFVIDMGAGAEAYFELGDMTAWHLYVGEKPPEKRIRADVFNLFRADAYLMLDSTAVALGATIGYDNDWKFGPVRVRLFATIGGDAIVSWKPTLFWGYMVLEGGVEVRACGITVSLYAGADLELQTPTPYLLAASVWVRVKLPWPVKDFETTLKLVWQEPDVPPIPVPLESIAVEHLKVSDKWNLAVSPRYDSDDNPGYFVGPVTQSQSDVPLVPVDGRIFINFSKPVQDVSQIGDNYTTPATEKVNGGEYKLNYYLDEVSIVELQGNQEISIDNDIFGVWQWKNEGDPDNICLMLWGRSAFDYTNSMVTQLGYIQGLVDSADYFPCNYQTVPLTLCVDFEDYEVDPVELRENLQRPFLWDESGFIFHSFLPSLILPYDAQLTDTTKALYVIGSDIPFAIYCPAPMARIDLYIFSPGDDPFNLTAYFTDGTTQEYPVEILTEQIITIAEPDKLITHIKSTAIQSEEFYLLKLCYVTQAEYETTRAHADQLQQLHQAILENWSGEAELLKPNTEYKITVTTRTVRTGPNGSETEKVFEQTALFQTGGPPGCNGVADTVLTSGDTPGQLYPASGQLVDLAPYIQQTVSVAGGQFHYRTHDIGLLFNESYVEQMYLMHGDQLLIEIYDSNGEPLRDENGQIIQLQNSWGDNPTSEPEVSTSTYAWLLSSHECVDMTTQILPPNQELIGMLSVPLLPLTMYEARLKSGAHTVYQFTFFTSRFGDFAGHIGSFTGRVWDHFILGRAPTFASIVTDIGDSYEAKVLDDGQTFDLLAERYELGYRQLPEVVELTSIRKGKQHYAILVESPEPLDMTRIDFTVHRLTVDGTIGAKRNTVVVANQDQTRLLIFRERSSKKFGRWQAGNYQIDWSFNGDIGEKTVILNKGGQPVAENLVITFTIP
jgi:hypothetical protein